MQKIQLFLDPPKSGAIGETQNAFLKSESAAKFEK